MHEYYVYILQCSDESYYTGVTNNYELRIEQHNAGHDPRSYTYKRRPVELAHLEIFQFIDEAISREKQIQRWSRKKKRALISRSTEKLRNLAKRQRPFL